MKKMKKEREKEIARDAVTHLIVFHVIRENERIA